MKALQNIELQGLHWLEVGGLLSHQELRGTDDQIVATMQKQFGLNNIYEVKASGNRWHLKAIGIVNRQVEIRNAVTNDLVSTFHYEGIKGDGYIVLPDVSKFQWKKIKVVGDEWSWFDSDTDDEPAMTFATDGFLKAQASLVSDSNPQLPFLLVFLGWYLHTMARQARSSSILGGF